jgi:hypothetical protein
VEVGAYEIPPGGVFVDEHTSGARLDRPALDRLRDLAAEGVLEAVLVWSPDRPRAAVRLASGAPGGTHALWM